MKYYSRVCLLLALAILTLFIKDNTVGAGAHVKLFPIKKKYKEIKYPTPNYDADRINEVLGVVLHHTAEPTVERSLAVLSSKNRKVGTHVVIDTDGTRYIMAEPTVVAYHAGLSILNGRENCNYFTIGIEFQGNTLISPLTDDQIASGIDYLMPILVKYNIPINNIVTHEMIRNAYKQKYPQKRCSGKVDITSIEYKRFLEALKNACPLLITDTIIQPGR